MIITTRRKKKHFLLDASMGPIFSSNEALIALLV
tara:strand:+ start:175 stop:276 length:102 start_codon:yes stop_codon:yes gene_type:complete